MGLTLSNMVDTRATKATAKRDGIFFLNFEYNKFFITLLRKKQITFW